MFLYPLILHFKPIRKISSTQQQQQQHQHQHRKIKPSHAKERKSNWQQRERGRERQRNDEDEVKLYECVHITMCIWFHHSWLALEYHRHRSLRRHSIFIAFRIIRATSDYPVCYTFHISIHKCSKNTSNHKNVIEYIFHILSRLEWHGARSCRCRRRHRRAHAQHCGLDCRH